MTIINTYVITFILVHVQLNFFPFDNAYINQIDYIQFSKAISIAATITKMQARIISAVLLLIPVFTSGAKLTIDTILTNFEDRLSSKKVVDEFKTIDPTTQVNIETQELLSIKEKTRTYSSKGIMVTNSVLELAIPVAKYKSLSSSIDQLVKTAPRDTYVKSLVKKQQKVEKFYDSICNLSLASQRQMTRRFVVTIFIASITALLVSVPTTVGIVAGLGAFEDAALTKEEIDDGIENNFEKEDRDDFFNNKIEAIRVDTKSLEARLNIQDQAHTINRNLDNMFGLLSTVLNPELYNFEDNFFLAKTLRGITGNHEFMELLNGNKFGLDDQIEMLTLSESDSFVITSDENHKCSNSYLVQKLKTVIPDDEFEAEATDDEFRYKLTEDKSLWINPDLIMTPSKFRPHHTFSKQRTIVGANEKIASVLPYNNTVLFVRTDGHFEMTRTCGEVEKTFTVFENPIFHIPLGCSLTSRYLNVSSFKIIYNNKEIKAEEDFNIDHELFHPVYDVEDIHTEAYNMRQKIHKIFTTSQRISHIELEKLQKRETLQRVTDKVSSIFTGIKKFCKSVQDEFILEPLYHFMGYAITGIVGLLLIVIFLKFKLPACKK